MLDENYWTLCQIKDDIFDMGFTWAAVGTRQTAVHPVWMRCEGLAMFTGKTRPLLLVLFTGLLHKHS